IAADTAGIVGNVEGGLRRIGEVVPKRDVIMHPGADGLDAWPTGRRRAKKLPGDVGEFVDFAITAGQKERERVAREVLDLVLRSVGTLLVGPAAILDHRLK